MEKNIKKLNPEKSDDDDDDDDAVEIPRRALCIMRMLNDVVRLLTCFN